MPVPTKMADLFLAASSNSPAGSDAIGTQLDDYLRALAAIIRSTNSIATSTIASAATIDLAASDAESVIITGTTTISSFGTGFAGCYRELRFSGALQLTHSASLNLGGANIAASAGDAFGFRCVTPGNWLLVNHNRLP